MQVTKMLYKHILPHANNAVQIGPDSLGVRVEHVGLCGRQSLVHDNGLHGQHYCVLVVVGVYVGHIAAVQYVVHVL